MNTVMPMQPFTTEKGNELFFDLRYRKGGVNPFTHREEARGYVLSVQRDRTTFAAFEGLDHEKGAVRLLIHEVTRNTQKQRDIATELVTEKLKQITDSYNL